MPRHPRSRRVKDPRPGFWVPYAMHLCEEVLAEVLALTTAGHPAPLIPAIRAVLARMSRAAVRGQGAPAPEAALIGRVSPDALRQIHRIVAHDLHPDKGGDAEAMKSANAAWTEIKKRRGMA